MENKMICAGSLTRIIKEYFDDCGIQGVKYVSDLGKHIKLIGLEGIDTVYYIENTDNIFKAEWWEELKGVTVHKYITNALDETKELDGLRLVELQWDVLGIR